MEFDTNPESDESASQPRRTVASLPSRPSTSRAPLDFGLERRNSLASQRKLVMLVLLLIGVIYAMIEAGKPERWYWLLPPDARPAESRPQPITIEVLEPRSSKETPHEAADESSQRAPDTFSQPEIKPAEADADENVGADRSSRSTIAPESTLPALPLSLQLIQASSSDYPNSAFRFWAMALRQLSSEQRRDLFWLIKRARHRQQLSTEQTTLAEKLLAAIRVGRIKFHQDLLDQVTYSKAGADEKAQLANDHFEAETTWDRGEWPAFSAFLAGEPLTEPQQFRLQKLQAALDRLMLDFVEDKTAQGWEGDSPAWGRMWERLMFEKLPDSTRVSHLELSAQAATYRNQAIQVRGWVRGAWKELLPIRELGIEDLFVLAVRPEDSKVTPYFLYLRKQPPGFPPLTRDYQHFNQAIVADGLFFKIRTYLDTEQKVQNSPMILVDRLQLVSSQAVLSDADPSPLLQPAWLGLAALLLPALAVGVAWFAFRFTQTHRFQPGPNRTREIHQELGDLIKNSEIKTDRERVRELYD